MGLLFFLTLERFFVSPGLRTAILTGGLGGFTAFSTFAMETLLLVEDGQSRTAVLYVAASVVMGFAAAFAGVLIARSI
ncbi:MAG: CrcB family protein [Gammaproteobacteria bacterium]